MKSTGRRAFLGSASAALLCGGTARAEPTKIVMGTAMEGGTVAAYGASFISVMRSVDPIFEIKGTPTKNIMGNVAMLEAGEADIALVFGEVAHELFAGIGRPPTKLKVVCVMYSTPGMFVVRSDTRFREISDLRRREVVWNGRDSGLAVQARYVMDGLGLDIDRDFTPIYTDRITDGPPMVIDGRAAALWGGGRRWLGFLDVANNPRGARFIVPTAGEIEQIRKKHPFMASFTVPASTYRGQQEPLTTVGTWSFVLARADLDEAVGYRLAAGLHKAERLGQLSKQVAESTVKNTLAAIPSKDVLQPGVARYFKEKNLMPA